MPEGEPMQRHPDAVEDQMEENPTEEQAELQDEQQYEIEENEGHGEGYMMPQED